MRGMGRLRYCERPACTEVWFGSMPPHTADYVSVEPALIQQQARPHSTVAHRPAAVPVPR
jgi:hypothetical protein